MVEAVTRHHAGVLLQSEKFDLAAAVYACAAVADYVLARRSSSLDEAQALLAKLKNAPSVDRLLRWADGAVL